jgi:hypothetical protein
MCVTHDIDDKSFNITVSAITTHTMEVTLHVPSQQLHRERRGTTAK